MYLGNGTRFEGVILWFERGNILFSSPNGKRHMLVFKRDIALIRPKVELPYRPGLPQPLADKLKPRGKASKTLELRQKNSEESTNQQSSD